MQSPPSAPVAPDAPSRKWWAMLGVGLGVFMSTLDGSIVNIALPSLVRQLHTTFATVQWVVLSYLLVITSLMLSVARLGDMVSKKPLYLWGLGVFTAASLLCGLAPGVEALIGFRALQGVGGVVVQALAAAIVTQSFPPEERGRAIGVIGAVVSLGIALGPSVGGVLLEGAGWRWLFLINVPIGIGALFVVARVLPAFAPGQPGQRFDIAGALLLMATLLCYALGMTFSQRLGFGDARTLALLGAAALGVVAFVVLEARTRQPMIDLGMFRNVRFGLNLLIGLLVFIVIVGYAFLMPFFLEQVKGYGTAQTGLMIAAVPVLMGLIAPLSGMLSDRLGSQGIILAGLLILAGGFWLISTLRADVTVGGYLLRVLPLGIGFGVFQSPNNSAVMGDAPRERLGVASGLLSLSRTLGQTTGFPLMGALFTALVLSGGNLPAGADITAAGTDALVGGLRGTFRVAALIVLAAAALSATAWRLDRRQHAVR